MKKYLFLTFVLFIIFTCNVSAKENVYFTSSNGVEMTELEYNNVKAIHGEEFLNSMDLETFNDYYEFYSCQNLEIKEVSSNDLNNNIVPFSNNHSTESKDLSIISTKNSNNEKLITIKLHWKKLPKIRSYDVFGFLAPGINYSGLKAKVNFYGTLTQLTNNINQTSNGYGISVKLPTDCNQISMEISFKTTSSGTIYASYQHSVKNISLYDSMNYTFSYNGLGKVFLFNNESLFDKMGGVEMNI